MSSIVIVSSQCDPWRYFAQRLNHLLECETIHVRSGQKAMEMVAKPSPAIVIVDQSLSDMTGIDLVRQIVCRNAMVNVALVSTQSEEDFHHESEGLGILMQLSPAWDLSEADKLAERLRQVAGVV